MMERQVIGILVLRLYVNAKRYTDDLGVLFLMWPEYGKPKASTSAVAAISPLISP